MGKGITQPGSAPAEQPDAAQALAAQNEQAKAATTAGTAEALAASDGPLANVEAGLNQDDTAAGDAKPEKEGDKIEPIIALATVQPLITKKPSELSDPEAELLGKYYTQEAKLCSEKGETFKALMMHLRALLTSLKLDFLNPPKDEAKTTTETQPSGEAPLAAPSPTEKPTTLETVASEVEQAKGVPGIVLLAVAKVENKETTKDNLTLIAADVLAKLAKEKPDKNDPVKYLTAYLEKKLGLKKEDPASQKRLADEIAKHHLAINAMHGNKEISYTGYYAWASRMQAHEHNKAIGSNSNAAPIHIDRQVAPEFVKEAAPTFRDTRVNYTGQISERIGHKLNNNPQLMSWMMKCCEMFNVNPNIVAAVMAVECGNEGKNLAVSSSPKFNFASVNVNPGTHAQGAPQLMPAYVEKWLRRDKSMMDSLPELAHARGKGTLWVRRDGQDVTRPVQEHEYDVKDPYVGIFYSALFVRNHLRNIVKNGSYKKITPNWQDLDFESATGMVYANHNMGAGGASSFMKKSAGNLKSNGVVARAMKYVKLYNQDKQVA